MTLPFFRKPFTSVGLASWADLFCKPDKCALPVYADHRHIKHFSHCYHHLKQVSQHLSPCHLPKPCQYQEKSVSDLLGTVDRICTFRLNPFIWSWQFWIWKCDQNLFLKKVFSIAVSVLIVYLLYHFPSLIVKIVQYQIILDKNRYIHFFLN